ncbi:hypothetical protein SS37A_18180 [Methylocystis iwaonis]|uniref:Uncharacterized protein n=1 Tax=Methylocystis iwaonis TaxID=2885079 RepID=A0ABN6VFA9_9HYPH|nr:hypothetical protein SS37A_18180 [Methylocystis iwaonis]
MRSRAARGSMGGGVDVSTGGSGANGAPASAGGAAGGCFTTPWGVVGVDGFAVPGFVAGDFCTAVAGALGFAA